MTLGEFAGFLAALLTFTTFYMKTMLPLRIVGISSNVAFLTYVLIEDLVPIMILHCSVGGFPGNRSDRRFARASQAVTR
jgi:hypothetical protein